MTKTIGYVILLGTILTFLCVPPCFAQGETGEEVTQKEEAANTAGTNTPQELSTEQKTTLIQFFAWAGSIPQELTKLKISLKNDDYERLLKKKIPALTADIRDIQWEVATVESAPYLLRIKINQFQRQLDVLERKITNLDKELAANVAKLSTLRQEWLAHREKLLAYQAEDLFPETKATEKYPNLGTNIDSALALIEQTLAPALAVGKDFSDLHVRLQLLSADMEHLDQRYLDSRFDRTTPTPVSLEFYQQISTQMLRETLQTFKEFLIHHVKLLLDNIRPTALILLLGTITALIIGMSRSLVLPSSGWYNFATCPIATTIILGTSIRTMFHSYFNIHFESQWSLVINTITILAVIRLIRQCINEEWKRILFIRISFYLVVTLLLSALNLPQILMLLFVLSASLAALVIYFTSLRVRCRSRFQQTLRNGWGVIPAFVLIAGFSGFDQLAIFVFANIISSIGILLAIWMLFHLNSGLLELLLKVVPFSVIRDNTPVIVKAIQPFIALLHIMLSIAILSVTWDIYTSTSIAFNKMFNTGYDVLGIHVSPGFILSILLVLNGALLVSRATQTLLLREVLPRYHAEKGVQLSIARLVHYGILTIGFLVLLKVLGFELRQLTILGGALGVGIGFGLQAIVNNFVGGLILLFERPIKVGDTIQVGTEIGEVKNLGLRATIIQTFDNAEIVVPNSDLITGQVTNWTLAERRVRVRIPVGVAYGTDVSKVLEILNNCATSHPMVLDTPRPVALFLAFGASSLDFELRFWIPEFLDKMTATSEMNQSIESEFAANDIEIPFTQADLHIRSVSDQAVRAWTGLREGKTPDQAIAESRPEHVAVNPGE